MGKHVVRITLIFMFWLTGTVLPLIGQDIHFTLYDMTPLNFNPAETGKFLGTYRLNGIVRDQYASVIGDFNEYKTVSLSADLPIIKGFRDQDWVGVGLAFYNDVAGTLKFSRGSFKISGAYHLGLGKNNNSTLSLGYQTGSVGFKFKDPTAAVFEDELLNPGGGYVSPDESALLQLDNENYTEHAGGLHFRSNMSPTDQLNVGISVAHIGEPKISLIMPSADTTSGSSGTRFSEVQMRYLGYGSYRTTLTDRVAIRPMVFYQAMGKATEIMIQGRVEYLLNRERGMVLHGGVGMRIGDALQIMAGMDVKDLRVILAYDLNTSSLYTASGGFGGFELAVQYIGKVYKRPDPDPSVFCPRF